MIVVNAKHTWLPQHPTVGEFVIQPEGGRRPYFNATMVLVSDALGSADLVAGTTAVVVFSMSDIASALEKGGGKGGNSAADDGCVKPPQTKRGLEQKIYRVLQRDGVSGASVSPSPIWATTRLLFLVHSDLPEPPTSAMTWVNMAALDAQAKLMFVWTPREAVAVLEGFLEDISHYATSSRSNDGGGNAGPFSLLPFGAASSPNRPTLSPSSSVNRIDGVTEDGVDMTQGTAATINLQGTARPDAHSGVGTSLTTGPSSPRTHHPTSKSERVGVALSALNEINGFNRTDAVRLLNNATTFADILMADVELELAGRIPELTKKKAARLDAAFNAPFPNTSLSLNDYLLSGGVGGEDGKTLMVPLVPNGVAASSVVGGIPAIREDTLTDNQQNSSSSTIATNIAPPPYQPPYHQKQAPTVATAPSVMNQVMMLSQNHQPFVFNNPATTAALQAMLDAELSDNDD